MQVIDLGLEVLDFLLKLEDGLPNDFGIQLVVVGELHDHHLVGVESTLHHPLRLENLLLHGFELCVHAPGTPWSLHIADVQHPLTHLNGLSVLQHLREIGVDNPLEKLVLGSAWRRHDALDLKQKQLETKTEDICVIRWSKPLGVYIMNFYRPKYVTCKKTESGRHMRCPRDRGVPSRGGALHSRGSLVSLSDYFFLPKILKYSKTDKNCHWSGFEVGLLTAPHTYTFSESGTFWKVSLMYSSGVTVSIILVSTLIGLPEI